MLISDGRGNHSKDLAKFNRAKIILFFKKNPGCTIKKCCVGTGLTYPTVKRHINLIKKEAPE